jgi:multiple sugar transport system permease protein
MARWPLRVASQRTASARRVPLRRIVAQAASYAAIGGVSLFFLGPWVWLVATSFKAREDIFDWPPQLIPNPWVWENYERAVTVIPFFQYMGNTLVICALVVCGRLLSCSLVAYAFARLEWKGRDTLFAVVLSTMMLPGVVTLVPLYVLFTRLGWTNSFLPLTVPAFFGDAFFIFMLRQFFRTIPFELSDAARIDGASEARIFVQIILPLAKPALATVAIFSFLWTYIDFLGPLIYLTDQERWTLSIGLSQFLGTYRQDWGGLMAACTLFTVPVILLFLFTQRYFIRGMVTSGLK